MARLSIGHNADAIAATLDAVSKRQFPFALANGINRTIEEIQTGGRRKLPQQFRFRTSVSRTFFERLVHIRREDRARKDRLSGTVGVQDPQGKSFKGKGRFLAKFQEAGQRRARPDGTPLLYPSDYLRPQPSAIIPRTLYPKALGLIASRTIEGGKRIRGARAREAGDGTVRVRLLGKRRTFAIDPRFHPRAPGYGVWQREGKGAGSETNRLWIYTSVSRYPKRITFLEDAQRIATERLALNVEGQLAAALNEIKAFRARRFEQVARAAGRL
jgi:hypothetical protein